LGIEIQPRRRLFLRGETAGSDLSRSALDQRSPGLVPSQRQLVVNCTLAGEIEEARAAFRTLVHLVPHLSLKSIANALPNIHGNDVNRTLDVFRLMGLS
jgi:hypothetical protein